MTVPCGWWARRWRILGLIFACVFTGDGGPGLDEAAHVWEGTAQTVKVMSQRTLHHAIDLRTLAIPVLPSCDECYRCGALATPPLAITPERQPDAIPGFQAGNEDIEQSLLRMRRMRPSSNALHGPANGSTVPPLSPGSLACSAEEVHASALWHHSRKYPRWRINVMFVFGRHQQAVVARLRG
jgi:hypothetical protein